jgi:hypothetical protein
MYVLIRNEDGKYVTNPGQEYSYTSKLENARIFPTKDAANAEKCGNENVVPVSSLLNSKNF